MRTIPAGRAGYTAAWLEACQPPFPDHGCVRPCAQALTPVARPRGGGEPASGQAARRSLSPAVPPVMSSLTWPMAPLRPPLAIAAEDALGQAHPVRDHPADLG